MKEQLITRLLKFLNLICIFFLSTFAVLAQEGGNSEIEEEPLPFAYFLHPDSEIHWYTGAPFEAKVVLGPKGATFLFSPWSTVIEPHPYIPYGFDLTIDDKFYEGEVIVTMQSTINGKSVTSEKMLVVVKPKLLGGIASLHFVNASIGKLFNPSTTWKNLHIPQSHYMTQVKMNGELVMEKGGTQFLDGDLSDDLLLNEAARPELIVYWMPNGTPDRSEWVPILSSNPTVQATIQIDPILPQLQSDQEEMEE